MNWKYFNWATAVFCVVVFSALALKIAPGVIYSWRHDSGFRGAMIFNFICGLTSCSIILLAELTRKWRKKERRQNERKVN